MTLTNYWWLLIWIAFGGLLIGAKFQEQPIHVGGKIEYRWSWQAAILVAFPYVIWAMNRSWFGDTEVYRRTFLNAPASIFEIPQYLLTKEKDKGFSILTIVLKTVIGNNDKLFFFLIAAFQMIAIVYFFRKYSNHFLLCMFMFVASTDYLSWMFNGIRQFIAVAAILFSFDFVLKNKYLHAVGVILLAATIHGSALIMLPIIFIVKGKAWNKMTIAALAGVAISILFLGQFTSLLGAVLEDTQYSDMMTNEIWINDDGTSMLRVLFYSVPAMLSLLGKRYIDAADNPVINLCVNCSVITAILYFLANATSGIYIGRLPIYTTLPGYISCAWLIDQVFTENSIRLGQLGLVFAYLVFFYYQMHATWGLI